MLKSVLSAIPTYPMSCFQLPISLCKRIQSVLTRFWWDGIDEKKKICQVAWDKLTDLDLTVSDLLTDDLKWNTSRIKEVLPEFLPHILSLQPSLKGAEDSYIWHATSSGVYSTKSGYYTASISCKEVAPSAQGEEFHWLKDVWTGKFSPKMKAFLWSIVQNALPLGTNLQKRGMASAAPCIRCKSLESNTHTFFNCPFVVKVWECVPLRNAVHIAADASFKDAIVKFRSATCPPPTGYALNLLPWICWAIWIARNSLIFEDRVFSPEETYLKGLRLAKEWAEAQENAAETGGLPPKASGFTLRESGATDSAGAITLKTNAAWKGTDKIAGLGWTFSGTNLITGATTQTFVRAITGKSPSKEVIGIVDNIRVISSEFASISFFHLPRSENTVSDGLAKEALLSFLYV